MAVIKKNYSEKKFRKLLHILHSPHHRQELEQLFIKEDQRYRLKEKLDKNEKKFLKEAGKIIKQNRGLLRIGRLIILGLPLAGLLVFAVFFMNPMLEGLLENALESTFNAQAEVSGFSLRPLQPGLSIDLLVQGDEKSPMRNLFEISDVELRLNLDALLRGSVVVENLQAGNISWGTERQSSATLVDADGSDIPADGDSSGAESDASGDGVGSGLLENLDADAVMADLENLVQSPQLISGLDEQVRGTIPGWQQGAEDITGQVREYSDEYASLLSTDISAINDVQTLTNLGVQLAEAGAEARSLSESAAAEVGNFRREYAVLQEQYREIRSTIDEEINLVSGQLEGLRAGELGGPLESVLKTVVEQLLGEKAALLFRGLEYYQRFRDSAPDEPGEGRRVTPVFRPGGVDVPFPIPRYPSFHLVRAAATVSAEDLAEQALEITDLSNQPELVGSPAIIDYTGVIGVPMRLSIEIDGREPGRTQASIEGRASNVELSFTAVPDFLEVEEIAGPGDIDVTILTDSAGGSSLDSRISLLEPTVRGGATTGIAASVLRALESAEQLYVGFSSGLDDSGGLVNSAMESNIPSLISSAVGREVSGRIEEYRQELGGRIEAYRVSLYDDLADSFGPAGEAFGELEGSLGQAESLEDRFDILAEEARQRIADLSSGAAEDAVDRVKDAAQDAVQNLPSLPSLPGRRN
jgi:uncharacterized protein (TIGR03545 family)